MDVIEPIKVKEDMLVLITLIIISVFFPPIWILTIGHAIYLFMTKEKRRNKLVSAEIVNMINTGKTEKEAFITFADARAFSKAMGGGIVTDAGGARSLSAPHSFSMDYNGSSYIIYFHRNEYSAGTVISISKLAETVDEHFEKYNSRHKSFQNSPTNKFKKPYRLIEVVNKHEVSPNGCFQNAHDELLALAKNKSVDDNLIKMAYGYAIRTAGAALFLQGIISKTSYLQITNSFKQLQHETNQTVKFQEDACSQAVELIMSYDHQLSENNLKTLVIYVEQNIEHSSEQSSALTFNELINKIKSLQTLSAGLSPEVISFINNVVEKIKATIGSTEIARQFIMEELDAARQGNLIAIEFVESSGFSPEEYVGAMNNSLDEVDGANGPQQLLLNSLKPFWSNKELMVSLRLEIVKKIIILYGIKPLNS